MADAEGVAGVVDSVAHARPSVTGVLLLHRTRAAVDMDTVVVITTSKAALCIWVHSACLHPRPHPRLHMQVHHPSNSATAAKTTAHSTIHLRVTHGWLTLILL